MRPLVVQNFTPKLKLLLTVLLRNTPSNDINQQSVHPHSSCLTIVMIGLIIPLTL
jgi:hypothetical protein